MQAINYVSGYGQTTEARYPYTSANGKTGACNTALTSQPPSGTFVKLSGKAKRVTPNSEYALMQVRGCV